jgi:uncharacterized protein (UPF0332 family)
MPDRKMLLSKYRIEKAQSELASAQVNLRDERFAQSLSDSYYAIFHSLRAVLALDGKDYKKHSAVISFFLKDYIKSGLFPQEMSAMIQGAFQTRAQADYEDFYVATNEDAETQLINARMIVDAARGYIENLQSKTKCRP